MASVHRKVFIGLIYTAFAIHALQHIQWFRHVFAGVLHEWGITGHVVSIAELNELFDAPKQLKGFGCLKPDFLQCSEFHGCRVPLGVLVRFQHGIDVLIEPMCGNAILWVVQGFPSHF